MTKIWKQFTSFFIVSHCCFCFTSESAKAIFNAIFANLSSPLLDMISSPRIKVNAFTLRSPRLESISVSDVLRSRTKPEISPSIIKPLAVSMVNFLSRKGIHNDSMHIAKTLLSTTCWIAANVQFQASSMNMPFPTKEPLIITLVKQNCMSIYDHLFHTPAIYSRAGLMST